jgi:4-hydroxybenzoate polyprenyltransferase
MHTYAKSDFASGGRFLLTLVGLLIQRSYVADMKKETFVGVLVVALLLGISVLILAPDSIAQDPPVLVGDPSTNGRETT